jgi:predicted amidophosphoribosyltransferase
VLLLPLWLFVVLLAGHSVWLRRVARQALRRERAATGLCHSCGYDLRATRGVCPECGSASAVTVPAAKSD